MEAPSCWPTVTVAEATPASWGATPKVPVLIDGAITSEARAEVSVGRGVEGEGRQLLPA
jgi:hypothetical protein